LIGLLEGDFKSRAEDEYAKAIKLLPAGDVIDLEDSVRVAD
jgi:hypothetical protein